MRGAGLTMFDGNLWSLGSTEGTFRAWDPDTLEEYESAALGDCGSSPAVELREITAVEEVLVASSVGYNSSVPGGAGVVTCVPSTPR